MTAKTFQIEIALGADSLGIERVTCIPPALMNLKRKRAMPTQQLIYSYHYERL